MKTGASTFDGTVDARIEADIGGFLFDDIYLSFKFLFEVYLPSLSICASVFWNEKLVMLVISFDILKPLLVLKFVLLAALFYIYF